MDQIESEAPAKAESLGPVPYVIAAMSILPVLGMLFGIAAVIWGMVTFRRGGKIVVALGLAGICAQTLIFAGIVHFALA